jgi:hypothetical protein
VGVSVTGTHRASTPVRRCSTYLGPDIVVITDEDREDLEFFSLKIEQTYNIILPQESTFRQLLFNPKSPGAHLLPYNTPHHLVAAPKSRKEKRQAYFHRSGKRARSK